MMIRTYTGGFLDFDGEVDVERQSKLFEALDETWGDYSYSFDLPLTQNNITELGIPFPDNKSKVVYNKVHVDLLSETGEALYKGFLRIERITNVIEASFFAGNNNWISQLTGNMTDLNLTQYDQSLTESNIIARATATSGIVFPIIDTGTLITRRYHNFKPEDFVGCFYLNTLFREVFNQSHLKIEGDLLNDAIFNQAVVCTNTRSKIEVNRNSISVGKNSAQVLGAAIDNGTVSFNLTSGSGYFVGDNVTFSGTAYTAAVDMIVDLEASITATGTLVYFFSRSGTGSVGGASGTNASLNVKNVKLTAGQGVAISVLNLFGGSKTITAATFKITPRFIYKAFGSSSVPLWTKAQFVSEVLSLFNTVTAYDADTSTVTINLLKKIKDRPATDISEYIQIQETDYSEFISNYGKLNTLSYQEAEDEDLREYNISEFNRYGSGVIPVDNDFLEDTGEILQSEFTAPLSYINPTFSASLEKINYVELEEDENKEITAVVDSSGIPQFSVTDADDFFEVGDLVVIESTELSYNGHWIIDAVTSTYFTVQGLAFRVDAIGDVRRMNHRMTTDDSVYLLINTTSQNVNYFSKMHTEYFINLNDYSTFPLAFFSLIHNETQVNEDFKQSLSLGAITHPLFYQRTMTEAYWGIVERILNDPVMLKTIAHFPEHIHMRLTPLNPVYIKTLESTNLYYINNESGYKGSSWPCEINLIKLP
jgi:hypothetical protein